MHCFVKLFLLNNRPLFVSPTGHIGASAVVRFRGGQAQCSLLTAYFLYLLTSPCQTIQPTSSLTEVWEVNSLIVLYP